MAGSLTSTDDSKTLSASSFLGYNNNALTATLTSAPHEFLQPSNTSALQDAALALAKQYLDPLLASNKNAGLGTVYLEGFDVDQVWEQVRGVVEGVGKGLGPEKKSVTFAESDSGSQSDDDSDELMGDLESGDDSESGDDEELSELDDDEEEEDEELADIAEEDEEEYELQEGDELEEQDDDEDESDGEAKTLVKDVHGLNDGFFSIDDFNRQTELLELEDVRGAPLGESDDEDEIDLHADPAEMRDPDEEDGSDAEDAALEKTLAAATGKDDYEDDDSDLEMDGAEEDANANGVMYEDFFAPPAKKRTQKAIKDKDVWRTAGAHAKTPEDLAAEKVAIESDMDRVRRDLFDDEDDEGSDVEMDGNPDDPMSRRSSHQKKQATLNEQIRLLEQQNVAKREWTLAGEAKARDRPLNSLLEQDLDFERSGKPVPVITAEVTENLEDIIKRRIIAAEFDEVIKRRPGENMPKFKRGRVEVDDSKPAHSLAEIYEKEHMASATPNDGSAPTAEEEKLEKEHAEISLMFADVSRKLDALTSWHYTPKPPKPTLSIVADAPAISMEEAQPSAAAGGNAANVSMLAPQELYKPGRDKAQAIEGEGHREIIGKSGAPISTREMSSDDKKRRRRREKQKIRKNNLERGVSRGEVKEGTKKDVVDSLRRGGVTVVGKEGEGRDVDGKLVKGKQAATGSFLKL